MKSKIGFRVVQVGVLVLLFVTLFIVSLNCRSTKVSFEESKICVVSNSKEDTRALKELFSKETLYIVYSNKEEGLPDESSYSEVKSGEKYTFGTTRFEEVKDNAKILTIVEYSDGVFSQPVYLTYSTTDSLGSLTIEIKPLDNNTYDLTNSKDFINDLLLSYGIK